MFFITELISSVLDYNLRDYPWRETQDPYRIMIAEFMLHRTRADQVVPVYLDFIKRYPTVESLAKAEYQDIKDVTDHLGLHWRSKHFVKAAEYVVEKFGGEFPDERERLREIPGIGDYVAGAILTVCFQKPVYVVDSNIARFINRYSGLGLTGEIRRKKKIIDKAKELFQVPEPGHFLFAIIDFTSLICKPCNPLCQECDLRKKCLYAKKSS